MISGKELILFHSPLNLFIKLWSVGSVNQSYASKQIRSYNTLLVSVRLIRAMLGLHCAISSARFIEC